MLLTLGFSPCPNDTFIFDALVNKHIDPGPFQFELALEDVQTLNEWALQDKLDISKISYGVWPLVKNKYRLLESGGALGNGCGPLLIAREPIAENKVNELRIAIPGRNTTAHLLFSMVYPQARNKVFMVFNEIEQALLDGQVDAGVIIHENRFTYAARGLVKITDLGERWEKTLDCPVPLGAIVVKKTTDEKTAALLEEKIRESIQWSFDRYPKLSPFVYKHAQEMSEDVMRQHIDLYVNAHSLRLGLKEKEAIRQLEKVYAAINGD
ncbi:MAG: 1,4-dihydroxy-6-naphthoate synthase [Bacteroidetes bacterium]|nr:1,4-dihydroxy-6-naphthoate synthase [Bacteroidota bacterium]HOA38432.1 1,4-dihydroxy-6-naphthoate synthase [Flavihumibacter sp.]